MVSIAIFNNKGGVGKTTYLYHLSNLLADAGKKVLMVVEYENWNYFRKAVGIETVQLLSKSANLGVLPEIVFIKL